MLTEKEYEESTGPAGKGIAAGGDKRSDSADREDLRPDSMALLELLVGLEKEFGIQVDEAELDPLKSFLSVESLSAFVFGSLQAGAAN